MKNNSEEKILGIVIDNKFKFKSHVKNLCKKSQKIWALSRLTLSANPTKWSTTLKQFVCLTILWGWRLTT